MATRKVSSSYDKIYNELFGAPPVGVGPTLPGTPAPTGTYDYRSNPGTATLSSANGYSQLTSPDGTVFGTSNYTPITQAFASLPPPNGAAVAPGAPAGPAFQASFATPPPATPAPSLATAREGEFFSKPRVGSGSPAGTFGGKPAPGSAGFWSDGAGASISTSPYSANNAAAMERLSRTAEVDRINKQANDAMLKRMGADPRISAKAPNIEDKIKAANEDIAKDAEQQGTRQGLINKARDVNARTQEVIASNPEVFAKFLDYMEEEEAKKKKSEKEGRN